MDALGERTKRDHTALCKKAGVDPKAEWITMEEGDRLKALAPETSRDTGADILGMIASGKVKKVSLNLNFAADSLFCEWAYVLDLDREVLEVYEGFQKKPTTKKDRFHFLSDKKDSEYYPIKILKAIPFKKVGDKTMPSIEKELELRTKMEENDETEQKLQGA